MSNVNHQWRPGSTIATPLELCSCQVDPAWVDYNGHMGESYYVLAFGEASDALFGYIGIDDAYRASGYTIYTAELHVNYLQEVRSGERLRLTTQLLGLDEKRIHIFHQMYHGTSGDLLCTTEQMLLHVDTRSGKVCPIRPEVYEALHSIWLVHQHMAQPA